MIKFSVVVPSYNYAHTLPQTINSVLAFQRSDIEIIVIDDASTDETPEVAARYGDRISYTRLESNVGPARAWAAGIEQATGDFVQKLDADDWVLPGFYDRAAAAFAAGADVVISSVYDFRVADGVASVRTVCDSDQMLDPYEFRRKLLRSFFFRMPGLVLRKTLVDRCQPPDARLRLPHDWEFFLRAMKGGRAALLAQPAAVYRVHEDSLTSVARRNESLRADLLRFGDLVANEDYEGFLETEERDLFHLGLGETFLRIVGAKLLPFDVQRLASDLFFAMRLSGGPLNRTKIAIFGMRYLAAKLIRRLRPVESGISIGQLWPSEVWPGDVH